MRRFAAVMAAGAAAFAMMFAVAGCSGGDSGGKSTGDASESAVILDVRTPEEYAEGHLEGAELLDFNSGEFSAALPSLDPDAAYFVYCRSGNRSGQAVAMMKEAGFTTVTDLGPMENAAETLDHEIVR